MDVSNILITANQAVEQANLPDDLRVIAFSKAIDIVSGTQAIAQNMSNGTAVKRTSDRNQDSENSALSRIARKLKIEEDVVREVFNEHDGEIEIIVPSAKFETGKKPATKQLALLVAASRQAAELEEFTSVDVIREVAEEFRRYDQPNFARTLAEMENDFRFRGNMRNREVGLSRPGWESATKLVSSLAGGEN